MPTAYDAVPYGSMAYWEAHPDRLGFIAHLFGLAPAPVERCRVLEVGCAAGGNLIPIADLNRASRFVGVDLAASSIAAGRQRAAALGLDNVEWLAVDLADFRREPESFDYIIAHGVYSWVEPPVAAALLDLIARHLAPDGVALVSHYVKPGWYARAHARDVMLWQARAVTEAERVPRARAFLELVVRSGRGDDAMRDVLGQELARLRGLPDWYVRHDHLAEANHACTFGELHAEIRRRGLAYLGDSDIGTMVPGEFPPEVQAVVAELAPELERREELLDHLRFRTFRMTLLCRDSSPVDRTLSPARLHGLHLSAPLSDAGGAALRRLGEAWPMTVPFESFPPEAAHELLRAAATGAVRGQLSPARCVKPAGEQPRAAAHARLAAAAGDPMVTNLRHDNVRLPGSARRLLALLDGSRDRAALAAELGAEVDVPVLLDELAVLALVLGR